MSQTRVSAPNSLQLTKRLRASRQQVFDAWTNPDYVRPWLCPAGATVVAAELDVRVGGRFSLTMRSGEEDTEHTGEYLEV